MTASRYWLGTTIGRTASWQGDDGELRFEQRGQHMVKGLDLPIEVFLLTM
jgi:hypothetical protein